MDQDKSKKIIGIIGGISSGKSCVATAFGENGCAVIDADRIAHQLLEDTDIKQQIHGIFDLGGISDKNIDRGKLAEVVFESAENLEKINNKIVMKY